MNFSSFLTESEAQGLDLHGVAVFHRGQRVASHWWAPYRPEARHVLYSLTKTFTALGVLFAVQEGLVSLDDRVVSFFPRLRPWVLPRFWDEVRVRHLLTMTLGFDGDSTNAVVEERDWVKALLSRPLDHAPGTKFVYNSMASYLASAVVQQVSGLTLRDWLVPRLFDPLGIADPVWDQCPLRRTCGGWGLYLTLDEVGRLGQVLLHQGRWEGRQLLDPSLVAEAVRSHVATGTDPSHDSHQGYGFQVWQCRHGAYRADGAFGQLCVVRPDLDLVVVVQAGVPQTQPILDLIWKHLEPTDEVGLSPTPRPEFTREPPALSEALEVTTHRFEAWRGQSWTLVDHPRGWAAVGFGGTPQRPQVWYQDDRGVHQAPFGWGRWVESRTRLWRHISQRRRLFLTVASGRWAGPSTLVLTLRFPEEAPVVTLEFSRSGDALVLAQNLSVTMMPSNFTGIRGSLCKP